MIQQHEQTATRFLFASLLISYPPEDFKQALEEFLSTKHLDPFSAVFPQCRRAQSEPAFVDDIRSRYIDLFDRGRSENPLYESEYGQGRSFSKGSDLVDIAAFYRAFGFAHGAEGSTIEMLDHIAVELEFYALMCLKEGALVEGGDKEGTQIVSSARRKFLELHLGRFPRAICSRPAVAADPYFGVLLGCVADLVERECESLAVYVESSNWYANESEDEQMLCGAANQTDTGTPDLVQIG